MGSRASAVIAQSVTECTAAKAGLPADRRWSPGVEAVGEPPLWGAVIDDLWVLRTDGDDPANREAAGWADSVLHHWGKIGVQVHPGKNIDNATGAEIQGALVEPDAHTIGLSPEKTGLLMRSLLRIATMWRPCRRTAHRVVGKLGQAHMFRPCVRSRLQDSHTWLYHGWEQKQARLRMTPTICWELVASAILLPLSHMRLGEESAPWCPRVVCSDASPGGHGLAYTNVPIP